MTPVPRIFEEIAFKEAAEAYLRSLPPEHFMEAVSQATQRKITVASMELVHAERPDIQTFNELLVQTPKPGAKREILQVVPDNMVVLWAEKIVAEGSFDIPFQPCGPFWMLEYVSKHSRRKDYEDNLHKYEHDLKVPYYLLFVPEEKELILHHLRGKKYRTVLPNEQDRYAIPELELEIGLLDGWVRFWFRGELLPLPAELRRELTETQKELKSERRRANREKKRADEQTEKAADLARRAEEETRRATELAQRATELTRKLDAEAQRIADLTRRAEEERQGRLAAEEESARLRAQLEQLRGRRKTGS